MDAHRNGFTVTDADTLTRCLDAADDAAHEVIGRTLADLADRGVITGTYDREK